MICDWCREPITVFEARTISWNVGWHARCWNEAGFLREVFRAACEDCEGFSSLPDELFESETGDCRSEVIPTMATQPNRSPREVVDFPANVPVTVALKYSQGKTVSSQYGERIMFSLADGRIMFLDPELGGRIDSLGINVRENF